MNTHRIIGGVAALALATSLAACSSGGSGTDSGADGAEAGTTLDTVGQILYGVDAYQQQHGKFFEEYAEELGISVRTINGENSQSVQDKGARDLINAGVDGIVIQPAEPLSATGTLKAIQQAEIPVLTWGNGEVPGITAPYVSLDEREQTFQAGVDAANAVQEDFPGEAIKMVVLDVPALPICTDYRMGEFIKGVQSVDPDAEVVAQPDGGGVRAQSKKVMEDVINSGVDFNIMTACNGESLLGALSALEAAGRGKAVDKKPVSEYIFSIDGSPAEVEKLLDPESSVSQVMMLTPYENARKLLDLLISIAAGETPEDYTSGLPATLVGPDCEQANELLEREYETTVAC